MYRSTEESYSEPSQIYTTELFAKITYGFQLLTIFGKSSILDGRVKKIIINILQLFALWYPSKYFMKPLSEYFVNIFENTFFCGFFHSFFVYYFSRIYIEDRPKTN